MKIDTSSVLKFTAQIASEEEAVFVCDLLSQIALATSQEKNKTTNTWFVEVLFEAYQETKLTQFLKLIMEAFKISIIVPEIKSLEQRDWLKENQESFPPLEIGNFYIYGSHIQSPSPGSLYPLKIDAATAFGSGNHDSTKGCLLALTSLYQDGYKPKSVLDVGCGSGILAMASASLWDNAHLVASDIDPECVRVTVENCKLNQLSSIKVIGGKGFENKDILQAAPYNLIIANILANVLCDIVDDLGKALVGGGITILSGILDEHQDSVIKAYSDKGFLLKETIQINEWVTLILKK
ncbi:MAG: 50S ribosomal protein L11 methyltransferase [Candidatus Paracaedibacteraceae bacterium]|nr:50S ribosomal protein L11 methyltransferase [Candidatus Paracaedibacteraceae bacterium]